MFFYIGFKVASGLVGKILPLLTMAKSSRGSQIGRIGLVLQALYLNLTIDQVADDLFLKQIQTVFEGPS
jgi:hypothetical protein